MGGFQALSLDKKKRFVLSNNMCVLVGLRVGHFAKDCVAKSFKLSFCAGIALAVGVSNLYISPNEND